MELNQCINDLVETLSHLEHVQKILQYGSSTTDKPNPRDIDVAVILDDSLRVFPLDESGCFPFWYAEQLRQIKEQSERRYGRLLHIVFYWMSEFNNGVILDGGRKSPPDVLNDVGVVKYDAETARILSKT